MADYVHELQNHTLRLRLTPEAFARLTAMEDANRAQLGPWFRGLGARYYAFCWAMNAIGNISEAYLLRDETADSRPGTMLHYREAQARIPSGFEITVTGTLPESVGMCRVVAPLFSTPVTDQTRFPLRPLPSTHPIWTMRDYVGHLGSHVPPHDQGGAGGGRYPGMIQRGQDCTAVLDGIHYLIRTPWSEMAAAALKALPAARWLPRERAWQVKKRWHRLIGLALDEIDFWERDRLDHLWGVVRDQGLRLDALPWARERSDGSWQVSLPPGPPTPALRDLLRSVRADVASGAATVRARHAPDLALISAEIGAEFEAMRAARQLADDRAEYARQQAAVAAAAARRAEAESARWRAIFPVDACPAVGDVIELRGRQRRVVELGRAFGGETVAGLLGPVVTPRTRYAYTEEA